MRLLRVINGVSCERGDDCLSYNLIEKTPGEALVSRRVGVRYNKKTKEIRFTPS